tara:strand:- start:748 stop:2055 length:1308 start_codon:yes stop_codon:yes gene_type:complete
MGSNLTIGITYYNQIEAFNHLKEHYKDTNCKFIICDDGSSTHPLTEKDMPDNWSLLTIEEDIGFNSEGARNLIMNNVQTEWSLLVDLDYLIEDIDKINLDKLDTDKIYSSSINHNQFIIYTEFFRLLGGYPITGVYGKKGKTVDQYFLNKAEIIELSELSLINNVKYPDSIGNKYEDGILLGSGCSFTDMRYLPLGQSWVAQLADDLEMLSLNVGQVGYGNQAIYNNVIDKISQYEDKIGLVAVAWSTCDRLDIETGLMQDTLDYGEKDKRDSIWPRPYLKYLGSNQSDILNIMSRGFSYLSFEDMLDVLINRTLRLAYELECICKYKNIPLIQFQALDYINKSDKEIWGKKVPENLSQIVKRIVDKSSFKPKFLGGRMWSWDNHLKSLGDDYRMGYDTPANHWVGYSAKLSFDMHPNGEGHTIIKDLIKKELNS